MPGDGYLEYRSGPGVIIVPCKGDIAKINAHGVVTRDDDLMEEESMVTKALTQKYSDYREKRAMLKRKTKFLFWTVRFKQWSIQTTKLAETSAPAKFVFHAIMKQASECEGENWEENMEKLFSILLKEVEKTQVKSLAVPLLGSGKRNAKSAARVVVKCFSEHTPKHLRKVFLVSKGKTDIYEIITCCRRDLILIHGNQPDGTMDVQSTKEHLPGYERYNTLTITYSFPGGTQGDGHPNPGQPYKGTTREAYLPDSTDGREVLALLRSAFDRKLIFTIGKSKTTGQGNVVKWNCIKHKTSKEREIKGKAKKYGFPDPSYLDEVRKDLATRGITKGRFERVGSESESGYAQRMQDELNTLQRKIQKRNLVIKENDAKGDCMFKALSQQIEHKLHKTIGHMQLRKELVGYLRDNPKTPDGTSFAEFIEKESWENYLKRMTEDGQWGDHLMLKAAANLYTVVIVIIKPGDTRDITVEHHGYNMFKRSPKFFLGHVLDRHYVSLESSDR